MSANEAWDIVGFGVVAVDDVFVTDHFPVPGDKVEFKKYSRVGGGQTATAFVAASRLGSRCFFAGYLGENALSAVVRNVFVEEDIGFRDGLEHPEARPTHSLIIVNARTGERSNMSNLDGMIPAPMGGMEKELIANAKCLFVDQSLPACQLAAARVAKEAGVPVVGDLESLAGPERDALYRAVDHLIIPLGVAKRDLGVSSPEQAVERMLADGERSLACVTDGVNGAWYASAEEPGRIRHQPAFPMPVVVDTNGCGDVFHGAYAATLANGLSTEERIRCAAAAAALKTMKVGGQTGAPTLEELETFLQELE